jgi:hypothetical protein
MGCCFTFPRASAAAELKAVITSFSIDPLSFSIDPLSVPEETHRTNGILRIITCNNMIELFCIGLLVLFALQVQIKKDSSRRLCKIKRAIIYDIKMQHWGAFA